MKKVGITACSNAQKEEYRSQNVELAGYLRSLDILPVISSCMYEEERPYPDSAKERTCSVRKSDAASRLAAWRCDSICLWVDSIITLKLEKENHAT